MKVFETQRRIEFRETDAAGIAHFSSFFAYMEEAEHSFWRALGLSVLMNLNGQKLSWPRVRVDCEYRRPVRFEDQLDVSLHISKLGSKSLTFRIEFSIGEQEVAVGTMTTVCCKMKDGEPPQPIAIPESLRDTLSPWADGS